MMIIVFLGMIQGIFMQPCSHPVYCGGEILNTVQTLAIFNDSKTFVDMPMKFPLDQVLQNWTAQVTDKTNKAQVQAFVDSNFLPAGSDSEPVVPVDWTANPPFADKIVDSNLKAWGLEVNNIWKTLSKNFTMTENQSSLLSSPFPFVIAGGRFREFYYWDSLWITEGLLLSGMIDSALHMLRNFAHMINTIGYVPNGARIYFIGRSQPPVTTQMADLIVNKLLENGQYQDAYNLMKEILPTLERERQFWYTNRSVKASDVFGVVTDVQLFHYDGQTVPRPESYKEDVDATAQMADPTVFYRNTWAACESGLDFSSRWFKDPMDIKTIRASDILPLDLNVFITLNEQILSKFSANLDLFDKAKEYQSIAQQRSQFILEKFFNAQQNQWNDYILSEKVFNTQYYPSNFVPLLLLDKGDAKYPLVKEVLQAIVSQYPGGIPQSLVSNNQQWDLPNSWAPFNHLLIKAALRHDDQALALEMAQNWVNNNYCSFVNTKVKFGEGYMFEKYDAQSIGQQGGGGEYEIQKGFGWTNGVAIYLLDQFGDRLMSLDKC